MERTVILDVEGLVTYPRFSEQIFQPLRDSGVRVGFWTHAGRQRLKSLLGSDDLSHRADFFLDVSDTVHFGLWSDELFQGRSSHGREHYRIRRGIDSQVFERDLLLWRSQVWKHGLKLKYPPLLGMYPALLVESDQTTIIDGKVFRDENSVSSKMQVAQETGYSVVMVPEHPDLWQLPQPASPEEVVSHLAAKLHSWHGEQIVSDIGCELGIYPKT